MAKDFTTRAEDYSKWYNELVTKADLAENSGVRGCMVIKPYVCKKKNVKTVKGSICWLFLLEVFI